MQRIPNPVSDLDIFIRVFRDIYDILNPYDDFGLDDISRALIAKGNVTSQGAIGDEALIRSTREDRSRDPIYNQSKMYAELYRTLGWIQSTKSSLVYSFSLLGDHLAKAYIPTLLLKECLLGISYPNEVLSVRSKETIQVIGCILIVMDALGSISRDEIIVGPMSILDDTDPNRFAQMIKEISSYREKPGALEKEIQKIEINNRVKRTTLQNYTRFPIAAFPWAGWAIKKSRGMLHITEEGKVVADKLRKAPTIRLSHFKDLPDEIKPHFIRWTFYRMLERAGFDIKPITKDIEDAENMLMRNGMDTRNEVFFSPFQVLSRKTLQKWTPELIPPRTHIIDDNLLLMGDSSEDNQSVDTLLVESDKKLFTTSSEINNLIKEIRSTMNEADSRNAAITELCASFLSTNKTIFYPLVVRLFCLLGFDCRLSRRGQNYERADAIIVDDKRSIPIEIKSPGEELEVSVKGIRQALENKIILLSRKNYPTDIETTSLVVGFYLPNKRSEVRELINDIYNTYNVRIAVLDLRLLISLATRVVETGATIRIRNFHLIKGVVSVENIETACQK